MIETIVFWLIVLPVFCGILTFFLSGGFRGALALMVALADFIFALFLFRKEFNFSLPWAGFGIDFSFRLYNFSGFILLAAAFFTLLIVIYSLGFFKGKGSSKQFYAYILFSLSLVNGAVLADNLVVLLFFWEGLLLTLYGLIVIGGGKQAFKTATKALVIVGVSDLCMMAGIALTVHLAGTATISAIHLTMNPLTSLAFILLVIGAISKAGAMPFHTWIPDAAVDAPLPFMAFFPASMEKLLGIYFLARITLDLFALQANSKLSIILMSVGAVTIILAVMMALVQKDYKKLLSYHAISQVGYMVLGIGTCLPAGIIGGIFHMLNHALYKCGLFLTGGAVEKQAQTTDLEKTGGLALKMPITFICFLITAASISGVPPFNGFFSKELVYDAALQRGKIFYLAAILGSFFTAASFLKLGHAAFLGKLRESNKGVKEAPLVMLMPMITLAAACVFLGLFNYLPINKLIKPIIAGRVEGVEVVGHHINLMLIVVTILVLLGAFIHHLWGVKRGGSALMAAEHIHHAPVLSSIYRWAQKKYFDPYEMGIKLINPLSRLLSFIDTAIDWLYNHLVPGTAFLFSRGIRRMHAGYYVTYVVWALLGAALVMMFASGRIR